MVSATRSQTSVLLSLLCVSVFTPTTLQAQGRLAQAVKYPLSGGTLSAVTSDFNGDKRTDMLTFFVTSSSSAVGLTLANSSGGYGTPKVLASFSSSTVGYVAAGDFNGDGKVDFAVALVTNGASSGSINVYLGHGDGTFAAPKIVSFTGGLAMGLLAGKVTGDSHWDLILNLSVNNKASGSVWVYAGNGDGTFAAPKKSAIASPQAQLALGDVNRDGHLDVAVMDTLHGNSYQVLLGHGDGTFTIKAAVVVSGARFGFYTPVIADYDNDGIPDLIFPYLGNVPGYSGTGEIASLFILSGYGDGTFKAGTRSDAGNSGDAVALGDFTGDGRQDLAVYNLLSSDIAIKQASSTTGLKNAPIARYAVGGESGNNTIVALLTGDANGDGKRDLLFVRHSGVQVLLGTGGGHMRAPTATEIQSYSLDLKSTDLNHDGYSDILIRGLETGTQANNFTHVERLYLAMGNSSQSLTKKPAIYTAPSGTKVDALGFANFNTDGNIDIVTRDGVMFNNGAAQFTQPTSQVPEDGEISEGSIADNSLAAGELNGDGKADIVQVDEVQLYASLGNGDGTFKPAVSYSEGGTKANSVLLRDINGDGKLDAITANLGTSNVSVFLGNGNGTFQAAKEFSVAATFPKLLAIGDFNGDKKLDIAVGGSSKVTILLGNGSGGFTTATTFSTGTDVNSIAAVSLRGNGLSDLIVADTTADIVRLFYSNGNGTFGSAVVYPVGDFPTSLVTGDFNADGAQDVAVTLNDSTAMPVFYNQGGTHISETVSATTVSAGQAVTFHATLTPSIAGNSTPTGTVTFKQGSTVLGTVTLSGGKGSFTTSSLSKGSHSVVAVYNGSSLFNSHTSAAVTVTVQ